MGDGWGWAGSVEEFLSVAPEAWLESLTAHHLRACGERPSASQLAAWREEGEVMRASLRELAVGEPACTGWSVIFEYELPLENGRRPDVVVLAGGAVVVLEFKQTIQVGAAAADQVQAYARDLAEYHEQSHGRVVIPAVVATRTVSAPIGDIPVLDPEAIASFLFQHQQAGSTELKSWLRSPYAPLPTLIAAARRIFRHEPLPHVRRALSSGIPEAVELLGRLAEKASEEGNRIVAFVAGVPGSGKTLAGLTLVYERTSKTPDAIFLSGNGPLVEVLRDALQSRAFVNDLHAFIKTYGLSDRMPNEHVIVFDEAQRAWDAGYMAYKHGVGDSEPALLMRVGERVPGWAALVGLVGDGQEIHAGEEAGIPQWRDALDGVSDPSRWQVHCPPRIAGPFDGLDVFTHPQLDLTTSLRSRRADYLHNWVAHLLEGELARAARDAAAIHAEGFPIYLTRDLADAKAYATARYAGEPDARYGLVASSRSQTFLPKFGVDNTFPSTKKVKLGRWYNEPAGRPMSCCALTDVVTEFGCQGLELDLPIVCWGDDYIWNGVDWVIKKGRPKYPLDDPERLRQNAYRVLLTRGRDGMVIFVPPDRRVDQTELALLTAGVRPLPADTSVLMPPAAMRG